MKFETRRLTSLAVTLFLISTPELVLGHQEKQSVSTKAEVTDLWGMPLRLEQVELTERDGERVLRGQATSRTDEALRGVRLLILVISDEGRVRHHINLSEALRMAGGTTAEFTFSVSGKLKVSKSERMLLAVEEATGAESIWRASEAELTACMTGEWPQMPEVRRIINLDDRMFRSDPIRLKP